jgi:hypothetical protein
MRTEPGKAQISETRCSVAEGWERVAEQLTSQGHKELAWAVGRFVERIPPPQTEKEWIAERLREQLRDRERKPLPAHIITSGGHSSDR